MTIYLTPTEESRTVGASFNFRIGLRDDAMPAAVVSEEVTIRIVDAQVDVQTSRPPKPPQPPKPPKGGEAKEQKGGGDDAPTHGLPRCVLLTKDGRKIKGYSVEKWPDDFTDTDGGAIKELGKEEVVYKINYDNAYHLKYWLGKRSDVAREVVTEKYILGMRILLLGYEHAFRSLQKGKRDKADGISEYADDFRRMAARGAASTVLALAENLPQIVDASAVQGQDVE